MGYLSGWAWQGLAASVSDAGRYLGWLCLGALICSGACWSGGYAVKRAHRAWSRTRPGRRRHRRDAVAREAARGIATLESYLAAHRDRPPDRDTRSG